MSAVAARDASRAGRASRRRGSSRRCAPRPLDAATVAWVARRARAGRAAALGRDGPRRSGRGGRGRAAGSELALAGTPDAGDPRWLAAALAARRRQAVLGLRHRSAGSVVTVVATVVGRRAGARVGRRPTRPARARIGRYVAHDDLGAALLRERRAPARRWSAWAGAHHRPERWAATGIPPAVCRALAAADGEPGP